MNKDGNNGQIPKADEGRPDEVHSWIPEMLLPHSVFRIERARLNLLRKIRQLSSEDSWFGIAKDTLLLFERAVQDKKDQDKPAAAKETRVNFVHFKHYPRNKDAVDALGRLIRNNRVEIETWVSKVVPNSGEIRQIGSNGNGNGEDLQRDFYELVIQKSRIAVQGYLSSILMNHYFGAAEKPLAYFGTISTDEGLPVTATQIDRSFNHTPSINQEKQEAIKIGKLGIADNKDFKSDIADPFLDIINALTTIHQIGIPSGEYAVLAIPVYSLNPGTPGRTGIEGRAMGTFCGWIYFYCEDSEQITEWVANNLLKLVLPLLDDFSDELLAGEAEEAIEHNYRNDFVNRTPTEFLEANLHTFCGWRVSERGRKDDQRAESAFAWLEDGDGISIALAGDLYQRNRYEEWITLSGMATTQVPASPEEKNSLGYHLAYRLRAIYRELEYIHTVSRVEELQKYKQMLELLQKPLQTISGALSTMQSESQELRAILFEPEEALFASHAAITPFFKEGASLPLDGDWAREFRVKHTPDQYSEEDARLLVACLLCAIFGELNTIRIQPHRDLAIGKAIAIVGGKSASDATQRLSRDLSWLLSESEETQLSEFLRSSNSAVLSRAILNVKNALFSPFKAMSTSWSPLAFHLLIRNELFKSCKCEGELANRSKNFTLPETPVTFAAVLAFLRDITLALRNPDSNGDAQRVPSSLKVSRDSIEGGGVAIVLTLLFSREIPDAKNGLQMSYFRKSLRIMAQRAPREWRIQSDHYGDSTRPFVFLVNKIVGLGENTVHGWSVQAASGTEELFVCEKEEERRRVKYSLGVSADRKSVFMKWETIAKT